MIAQGHFGEMIQGRLGGHVALISLPCPRLFVTATRTDGRGLTIHPPGLISPQRARRFLADLGLGLTGRIHLDADMPIGAGAGSSTAALVALARLAGWQGPPLTLARACLRAEGASDPLMLDQPLRVLWASRESRVVAHLPQPPAFDILGGFFGPPQRTLPQDLHFPDISDLLPRWIKAGLAQDLAGIAQIATISAKRTLALRGPGKDPIFDLADDLGALGVVIAHTGSARGLIYAPGQIPKQGRATLRAAGLTGVLTFRGHR